MEESLLHYCPVCGGSEFMKDNGYFYCQECQTQCEDIREQFFDEKCNKDDNGDILIGTPFTRKWQKRTKKEKFKKKGDDFTSWELLNFVLRGQVEELLLAGAPSSLKDTVLQLWAYYLQKLEAAFISKDEKILPKLSITYHVQDAELVYGLRKKEVRTSRRVSSMNVDLNSTIAGMSDWSSMQIKKNLKRKKKKALMGKVAEMSMLDLESISLDQSDLMSTSEFDDTSSVVSAPISASTETEKLDRTSAAKQKILNLTGGIEDPSLNVHGYRSSHVLTKYKLIALLYLGLMYEGSNIQISDLLRWIREGHLSFYEAAKHLPDTCFIQGRYHVMFSDEVFPSYEVFWDCANDLAKFLQVVELPPPNLPELAKKYVEELQLPVMFSDLIMRFEDQIPFSYRPGKGGIPNYEARMLATLIIILKMLFGLDGKTERKISKAASQLNKLLNLKKNNDQSTKLFVWNDWVKKLTCRNAVLSKYHFPTRHILNSQAYGNSSEAFITYCKKWNDANAGLRDKYNLRNPGLRVTQPALLNTFMSILDKLQDTESCNDDIDFPQCFTPYSTYLKNILDKSSEQDKPLLDKSVMEILTQDFSTCNITYLLAPKSVKTAQEDKDYHLKIIKKSAQKKFIKFPCRKEFKTSVPNVYKSFCYVVVSESGITKTRIKRTKEENKKKNDKIMEKKRKEHQNECLKTKSYSDSNFSSKSRKRKKNCVVGNKKKRKHMKRVKLYVPFSQYWVHLDKDPFSELEFETEMLCRFPFSFSWLLTQCALVSEMSKCALYREVMQIEDYIMNNVKPYKSI